MSGKNKLKVEARNSDRASASGCLSSKVELRLSSFRLATTPLPFSGLPNVHPRCRR